MAQWVSDLREKIESKSKKQFKNYKFYKGEMEIKEERKIGEIGSANGGICVSFENREQ